MLFVKKKKQFRKIGFEKTERREGNVSSSYCEVLNRIKKQGGDVISLALM